MKSSEQMKKNTGNRPKKKQVIKSLSLAFRNSPAKQHDDESEQNNLLEWLCECVCARRKWNIVLT